MMRSDSIRKERGYAAQWRRRFIKQWITSQHSGGGGSSSSGARYSQKPRSYHTAYRSHDDDVYVRYRNGTPQFRYVGKKEYRKCSKKFIILTSLLPAVLFPLLLGILIHALTGASIFSGRVRKPSPVTEPYRALRRCTVEHDR